MANLNIKDLDVCVQRSCEVKGLVPSVVYVEICSQLLPVQSDCVHSLEGVGPAARRHASGIMFTAVFSRIFQQRWSAIAPVHEILGDIGAAPNFSCTGGFHVPARFLCLPESYMTRDAV